MTDARMLRKAILVARTFDEINPTFRNILADAAETLLNGALVTLPVEPSPEMLDAMCDGAVDGFVEKDDRNATLGRIYATLRAHLLKPKTKSVQFWRVEYAFRVRVEETWRAGSGIFDTKIDAEDCAEHLGGKLHYWNVRVTGPHEQEVPV